MGIAYGQVFGRKHYNVQPAAQERSANVIKDFINHKRRIEMAQEAENMPKAASRAGKPYSVEELELISNPDVPFMEVAALTGRSYKAVCGYAREHKFPCPPSRYAQAKKSAMWTEQEDALITMTSLTPGEIADMTGRTVAAVNSRFERLGIFR